MYKETYTCLYITQLDLFLTMFILKFLTNTVMSLNTFENIVVNDCCYSIDCM